MRKTKRLLTVPKSVFQSCFPLPEFTELEKHFTASAYILHRGHVLLHLHPKVKTWLPPGGHLEPHETPIQAVLREVKEETGLDVVIWEETHLTFSSPHAITLPRPFLCLLENIPPYKNQKAHQHIDLIYLAKLKEDLSIDHPVVGEGVTFYWFNLGAVEAKEKEFLPEVLGIARELLRKDFVTTACETSAALPSAGSSQDSLQTPSLS